MKSVDRHSRALARRNAYAGIVLLLIGAGLGAGAYRMIEMPPGPEAWPATKVSVPSLVRNGQQIEIPEGSPLRDKLKIEAVVQKEIQSTLVLPAVVEADPARLVKVLPPLSGRITQLRVQLGQPVESGQPLAVLESSDLRTAYADYDRAKLVLALATKTRDRVRGSARSEVLLKKKFSKQRPTFLPQRPNFNVPRRASIRSALPQTPQIRHAF